MRGDTVIAPRGVIVAALSAAVLAAAAVSQAKPPKVATLEKCPIIGTETPGSTRAALNEVKHRAPREMAPLFLEFDDLPTLQKLGDGLVKSGEKAKVLPRDRAKLKDLEVRGMKVSEGDYVAMTGYIVNKPSANLGESANCYLRGPSNNDFEFNFAATPKDTPYQGIVGEMIPQNRPKEWSLARLRKAASDHRQVLVMGALMFDTRHVPNPKPGTNHEDPRVSTWEIHPITKMLVCMKGTCDAHDEKAWQPIESTPEK
jgi:hypothetical protein